MDPQKFVIVGDPHTGKSVFVSGLRDNLPLADRFVFRACPDGEGSWLSQNYDDPAVVVLRRKGTFTPEIVEWYAGSLAANKMAPIILVDVGGRRSEENEKILRVGGVQNAVILGRDAEGIAAWRAWLEKLGLRVVAELVSDYTGTEDVVSVEGEVVTGSVHFLERGEDVSSRPAIKAVAEKMLSVKPAHRAIGPSEVNYPSFVHLKSVEIKTADLARSLGKDVGETKIWWEGKDLPQIAELLASIRPVPGIVDVDGYITAWLMAAIAHTMPDSLVRQNSPDGFVQIQMSSPWGTGAKGNTSLEEWSVRELDVDQIDRKIVMVEFKLDPSRPLKPRDLGKIRPPRVPQGAVVVISGRGPHWLTASIAMAYKGYVSAVACWQPGRGATVCWTEVDEVPLGSVIEV